METITVRNIIIGEGLPKIIVPIVSKTKEDILKKAQNIKELGIDVVEWRVDHYEDVFASEKLLDTLKDLRVILNDTLILFTFRRKKEGGEKEISLEAYTELNKAVAYSGLVDLIDVEIFSGNQVVKENIENIHKAGVLVVGSNHDFEKTPSKEEILYRLKFMQDMGADIPKIAVMPNNSQDVLTLLDATNEMHTKYADRPIITMSMGPLGVISRVSGQVFGSSMTFGALGQVSAPGQLPVDSLAQVLDILNKSM